MIKYIIEIQPDFIYVEWINTNQQPQVLFSTQVETLTSALEWIRVTEPMIPKQTEIILKAREKEIASNANHAARELAKARTKKLSKVERVKIAKQAALTRWGFKKERCKCGIMTAKRAKARGHKCSGESGEINSAK